MSKKTGKWGAPDRLVGSYLIVVAAFMLVKIFLQKTIRNDGVGAMSIPLDIFFAFYGFAVFGCERSLSFYIKNLSQKYRLETINKLIRKNMLISFFASVIVFLVSIILERYYLSKLLNANMAALSFIMLAVSLIVLSVQGVLRAYFTGFGYSNVTIISNFLFAVSIFVFPLIISGSVYNYGLKVNALLMRTDLSAGYGAFGCVIGVFIATLLNLIFLICIKKIVSKKIDNSMNIYDKMTGRVPNAGIDIIAHGLVFSMPFILDIIDIFVYLSYSVSRNYSSKPVENIGIYEGGVLPIIMLTCLVISMIIVKPCYKICALITRMDRSEAAINMVEFTKNIILVIMAFAAFAYVMAETILRAVYITPTDAAVSISSYAAVVILTLPFYATALAILLKLRKFPNILLQIVLGFIVHLIVLFVMQGYFQIKIVSNIGALAAFFTAVAYIAYYGIWRYLHIREKNILLIIKSVAANLITGVVVYFADKILINVIGEILTLFVCIFIWYILYIILLLILRAIDEYEAENLPLGGMIAILANGFHFIG